MKKILLEMEKLHNLNSGLGQFCFHLGKQFQILQPKNAELTFYVPPSKKNIFGDGFQYLEQSAVHKIIPRSSSRFDVWHCLHQDSHYLPGNKNTKLILTIHDLNFLEKYSGAKQKYRLRLLQKKVNRADAITVISHYTEVLMRKNLAFDKPVHVIHNGNSLKPEEDIPAPGFFTFKNFIFSIGIILERKNFHTLLPLLQHNKHLHWVIAGNKDSAYARKLLKLAEDAGVAGQLHLPGLVDEKTKYWLYKNCTAFVFPSLAEGFGLPVIEAMSLGKPVFLSNLASLPEVGGSEAYYWKNFEPQHIIDVFEKGLIDFNSNKEKAKRVINRSEKFSWENAANAYLDLYEKI